MDLHSLVNIYALHDTLLLLIKRLLPVINAINYPRVPLICRAVAKKFSFS